MSRDNDTSRGGGGDNFFDAPQYDDDSHRDIGRKSPSDPWCLFNMSSPDSPFSPPAEEEARPESVVVEDAQGDYLQNQVLNEQPRRRESEQQGQATQQVGYGAYMARAGRYLDVIDRVTIVVGPGPPSNSSLYDTELMVSDNDEDPEGGTQGQEAAPGTNFPERSNDQTPGHGGGSGQPSGKTYGTKRQQ